MRPLCPHRFRPQPGDSTAPVFNPMGVTVIGLKDRLRPPHKLDNAGIQAQPNILFILTDDQGWATLGCYGSKRVATPHLDRLGAEGVRFTDAYVMPQCTPARAALLSGQHTARNGMWHVIPWYGSPWARVAEPAFREQFPRELPSLPKTLRAAGYKTGMAGKWHLTGGADGDCTAGNSLGIHKPESADDWERKIEWRADRSAGTAQPPHLYHQQRRRPRTRKCRGAARVNLNPSHELFFAPHSPP